VCWLSFGVEEQHIGHNSQRWVVEHPLHPDNGGYYQPVIAYDTDSGWSPTQTVTIPASSPSPSPTIPEYQTLAIRPFLMVIFSIAVLLRHRKTSNLNQ
jgi:hypothetical protein